MTFSQYIADIASQGNYCFTTEEACRSLTKSRSNILNTISYFKKKGTIISPIKGLFCYVPHHYRNLGSFPASQLLPIVMSYLGAQYYVCLLSAASYYGAEHQKVQKFQVMIDRRERSIVSGRVKIDFFFKKKIEEAFIQKFVVATGYLNVSSPELTMVQLIEKMRKSGGIDYVATVISELIASIDIAKLKLVLKVTPNTYLQRLGYILENIVTECEIQKGIIIDHIYSYLSQKEIFYCSLSTTDEIKGNPRNKKWKIIVNTIIETDI